MTTDITPTNETSAWYYIDFWAVEACQDWKDNLLSELGGYADAIDTWWTQYEILLGDIVYAQKLYCDPNHPCWNSDACIAYTAFLKELIQEGARIQLLSQTLGRILALLDNLDCESENAQSDIKTIKFFLEIFGSDFLRVRPNFIKWLYYKGYQLSQQYSRDCFPEDYEGPYVEEDGEHPDCLASKKLLQDQFETYCVQIQEYLKNCDLLMKKAADNLNYYCYNNVLNDCAQQYCTYIRHLNIRRQEIYRKFIDNKIEVMNKLEQIDCSGENWTAQLSFAQQAFDAMKTELDALLSTGSDSSSDLEDLIKNCPVPV